MSKESKIREGKPPLDRISPYFIESMAAIQAFGDKKHGEYGTENHWTSNDYKSSDIIAAIKRHVAEMEKGNYIDPDSGEFHGSHAALGLMYLHHFWLYEMKEKFDGQFRSKPARLKRRVPAFPHQEVGDRPTDEGTERS